MTNGVDAVWDFCDALNGLDGVVSPGDGRSWLSLKEVVYLNTVRGGCDTVTKLSAKMGVSKAAASKMADRMCSRQILTRVQDPEDGRIVRLVMPDSVAKQYLEENRAISGLAVFMEARYGRKKAEEFWWMMREAAAELRRNGIQDGSETP